MADISYKSLIAPSFYGVWNDVVQKKYPEIWLAGGRGCIDRDTLIDTPKGKIPVKEFKGGEVYTLNEKGGIEIGLADRPDIFTEEDLFSVETERGLKITVTDEHKFLTPRGWLMTQELRKGSRIITQEPMGGVITGDKIKNIKFKKRDYYWDFNVRGTHNYIAQGFVNHNSTKSSFISTCIPLLMEMNPRLHCVCFRKFGTNLADSVYAQFEYTINEKLRPIANHWLFKKSPLKIINTKTNQQILFRGLDDPQKVKSLKAPFGYFGLIWLEELAEFDGIEEVRNVLQSLRRGGHYFQTFCSYNPPETSANWVNYEASVPQIVDGQLYRYVHRSDYRSVPRDWLGNDFFKSAELLRQTNERAYRHEYLGEVTGNGGSVFPNVEAMEMSDAMISQFDNRRFAIDFGFSLDPCAFSGSHYDKNHRTVYVFDEIYETNLTNIDLAAKLKEKADEIGYEYIMCDSAEPKSIAELESFGINVLPVTKSPDSRHFSYRWLQSLNKIYVDPQRCPNTYRELSQCEYEKSKSGMFISRYPQVNDHEIDSLRYAYMAEAMDQSFC